MDRKQTPRTSSYETYGALVLFDASIDCIVMHTDTAVRTGDQSLPIASQRVCSSEIMSR